MEPGVEIDVQVDDAFAGEVDAEALAAAVAATLAQAGQAGAVTLVVTDDAAVQELNRTYRGIDAPTIGGGWGAVNPTSTRDRARAGAGPRNRA